MRKKNKVVSLASLMFAADKRPLLKLVNVSLYLPPADARFHAQRPHGWIYPAVFAGVPEESPENELGSRSETAVLTDSLGDEAAREELVGVEGLAHLEISSGGLARGGNIGYTLIGCLVGCHQSVL
jgi:hypothetical protein